MPREGERNSHGDRDGRARTPITDELIEQLADEAEAGYDVEELIARRGKRSRPHLGAGPPIVDSARPDPER